MSIEYQKCKNCGHEMVFTFYLSEEKDSKLHYFCKECHMISNIGRSDKNKACQFCKSKNIERYTTQKFKCPICKKEGTYEITKALET